jgi:hypothetical protein
VLQRRRDSSSFSFPSRNRQGSCAPAVPLSSSFSAAAGSGVAGWREMAGAVLLHQDLLTADAAERLVPRATSRPSGPIASGEEGVGAGSELGHDRRHAIHTVVCAAVRAPHHHPRRHATRWPWIWWGGGVGGGGRRGGDERLCVVKEAGGCGWGRGRKAAPPRTADLDPPSSSTRGEGGGGQPRRRWAAARGGGGRPAGGGQGGRRRRRAAEPGREEEGGRVWGRRRDQGAREERLRDEERETGKILGMCS